MFRPKGRSDLLRDLTQAPRVLEKQVRDTTEQRRRRLGTRDDKQARVGPQALKRDVPVLLLAQQAPDEVRPLDVEAHPPLELLGRPLAVFPAEPRVAAREPRDHVPQPQQLERRPDRLPREPLLDVLDHLVLLAALEAAEGFAEGHVADDVKGCVVVPVAHVEFRLGA